MVAFSGSEITGSRITLSFKYIDEVFSIHSVMYGHYYESGDFVLGAQNKIPVFHVEANFIMMV